jgi:hypothetical protein
VNGSVPEPVVDGLVVVCETNSGLVPGPVVLPGPDGVPVAPAALTVPGEVAGDVEDPGPGGAVFDAVAPDTDPGLVAHPFADDVPLVAAHAVGGGKVLLVEHVRVPDTDIPVPLPVHAGLGGVVLPEHVGDPDMPLPEHGGGGDGEQFDDDAPFEHVVGGGVGVLVLEHPVCAGLVWPIPWFLSHS